ncbi:MAG TPA: hypothetical protein VKY92_26030 [Verrucomicrobiae bacterium]|nr:hypothetical protein [Verrucomicrobiae bacterium]
MRKTVALSKLFASAGALLFGCLECSGQTNNDLPRLAFFQAPAHLRSELEAGPKITDSQSPATGKPLLPPAQVQLNLDTAEPLRRSSFRSDRFYLAGPTVISDSPGSRFMDNMFSPEVFRLKKVSIKCPIATAIKRKNPLALLSGLGADPLEAGIAFRLLQIDW